MGSLELATAEGAGGFNPLRAGLKTLGPSGPDFRRFCKTFREIRLPYRFTKESRGCAQFLTIGAQSKWSRCVWSAFAPSAPP